MEVRPEKAVNKTLELQIKENSSEQGIELIKLKRLSKKIKFIQEVTF